MNRQYLGYKAGRDWNGMLPSEWDDLSIEDKAKIMAVNRVSSTVEAFRVEESETKAKRDAATEARSQKR